MLRNLWLLYLTDQMTINLFKMALLNPTPWSQSCNRACHLSNQIIGIVWLGKVNLMSLNHVVTNSEGDNGKSCTRIIYGIMDQSQARIPIQTTPGTKKIIYHLCLRESNNNNSQKSNWMNSTEIIRIFSDVFESSLVNKKKTNGLLTNLEYRFMTEHD